jgi:membrane complex biogenesis BtpA family protein
MDDSTQFLIVGVLHLPALPGAPGCGGSFSEVLSHALRDAEALVDGGIDCCIIENFGDAPFRSNAVQPHVPAMMGVIGAAVRDRFAGSLSLGINVLRNDGHAALAVAFACQADFVRVNVFTGAAWTDQGLIEGEAASLTRYRRSLSFGGPAPRIMADILVKHARPAGTDCIATLAKEATGRGGADGLIVTGTGTGQPTDLNELRQVKAAAPDHPVWVGSGVTSQSVSQVCELADGVIVGTALHRDANIQAPIDKDRVRSFVDAARS